MEMRVGTKYPKYIFFSVWRKSIASAIGCINMTYSARYSKSLGWNFVIFSSWHTSFNLCLCVRSFLIQSYKEFHRVTQGVISDDDKICFIFSADFGLLHLLQRLVHLSKEELMLCVKWVWWLKDLCTCLELFCVYLKQFRCCPVSKYSYNHLLPINSEYGSHIENASIAVTKYYETQAHQNRHQL